MHGAKSHQLVGNNAVLVIQQAVAWAAHPFSCGRTSARCSVKMSSGCRAAILRRYLISREHGTFRRRLFPASCSETLSPVFYQAYRWKRGITATVSHRAELRGTRARNRSTVFRRTINRSYRYVDASSTPEISSRVFSRVLLGVEISLTAKEERGRRYRAETRTSPGERNCESSRIGPFGRSFRGRCETGTEQKFLEYVHGSLRGSEKNRAERFSEARGTKMDRDGGFASTRRFAAIVHGRVRFAIFGPRSARDVSS